MLYQLFHTTTRAHPYGVGCRRVIMPPIVISEFRRVTLVEAEVAQTMGSLMKAEWL